jgi:ribonuclease T
MYSTRSSEMAESDFTPQARPRPYPIYVSVDIETAGLYPLKFSMLQIGACDIFHPACTFSCNLKPINNNADAEALAVNGLPFKELKTSGLDTKAAITLFTIWLTSLGPPEHKRVMIGQVVLFD